MIEASPRRILNLVIEGFPTERLKDLDQTAHDAAEVVEIFPLTESNTREALEKIFAADTVAVWGKTT